MRNLLVGVGSVISLVSAVSVAQADPFNFGPEGPSGPWSGFYLGANGGKSWFNGSDRLNLTGIDNANDPAFATFVSKGTGLGDDGSFAGGQLGYGFQRGIFVFGAEADIEKSFLQDDANLLVHNDGTFTASGSTDLDWFGTVRGRVGLAFGRALFYGTAGFAYGRVDDKLFVTAQDF